MPPARVVRRSNPTQPEMRDYRLQFYEDDAQSGDFAAVATVTVSP